MRIGFDAKRLFHNDTGLGVYSRQLVEGLRDAYPENEYVLFAAKKEESAYCDRFKNYEIISSTGLLWRSFGMSRDIEKQKCDVFHGLSHELPIGIRRKNVPTIVTIHDIIFRADPDLFPFIDRTIYDLKWRHSCAVADVIIAVSEHTKSDICKFYGTDPKRITVVPPAVPIRETHRNEAKIRREYKLPPMFHLYVGSLTKRKNVISILRAMSMQVDTDRIPLVVVGSGPEKKKLVNYARKEGILKKIYFLGYVPEANLATLYKLAYAMIYPSFYEGFGIPIVEALLNKTPVITSNVSSMPEAAGPGGVLIDPTRPDELAHAMSWLLSNQSMYNDLSAAGYEHAKKFAPANLCKNMIEIYRGL